MRPRCCPKKWVEHANRNMRRACARTGDGRNGVVALKETWQGVAVVACPCPPTVARHLPSTCRGHWRHSGAAITPRGRQQGQPPPPRAGRAWPLAHPAFARGARRRGGRMAALPRETPHDTPRSGEREGGGRRGRPTGTGAVAGPQPPSTPLPASQMVTHGTAVTCARVWLPRVKHRGTTQCQGFTSPCNDSPS